MAERKATNKYYPPDWDPSKGSINQYHGQHPLRERAKKLDQGILVVRFEMPYNIWCEKCSNHIGKGVRFNAEKKAVGNYFSTKILNFRMKCHLCSNWIEIETDPKNHNYVVKSGARKKVEEWQPSPDDGAIKLMDDEERKKLQDPFYKLEKTNKNVRRARRNIPRLERLLKTREQKWKDDYSVASKLRKDFRETRKEIESQVTAGEKLGLGVKLLPKSREDEQIANNIQFDNAYKTIDQTAVKRKLELKASSIFGNNEEQKEKMLEFKKRKLDVLLKPTTEPTKNPTLIIKPIIKIKPIVQKT